MLAYMVLCCLRHKGASQETCCVAM